MLYNLSNKYLLDEEYKYPFYPKINYRDSNFYQNNQQLYEIPHKKEQYYTERNFLNKKHKKAGIICGTGYLRYDRKRRRCDCLLSRGAGD